MENNKKSSNLKFYLIIGIIVIALGVAYYFFYHKKKKNNTVNSQIKTSIPEVYQPDIPKSPTPPQVTVPYNTTLLDRLNSLKF